MKFKTCHLIIWTAKNLSIKNIDFLMVEQPYNCVETIENFVLYDLKKQILYIILYYKFGFTCVIRHI